MAHTLEECSGYSLIDKVVNVCSALCSCCESVTPFE